MFVQNWTQFFEIKSQTKLHVKIRKIVDLSTCLNSTSVMIQTNSNHILIWKEIGFKIFICCVSISIEISSNKIKYQKEWPSIETLIKCLTLIKLILKEKRNWKKISTINYLSQ